MVMYTERQLDVAYAKFVAGLYEIQERTGVDIFIPEREDFRKIYEDVWEEIYADEWWLDDTTRH